VVFLVGGLAASLGLMVLLSLAKGHRELAI